MLLRGFPGRGDGEIAIQYLVIQFDDVWVILEREVIRDWRFCHGWGDYASFRGRPYVCLPFFQFVWLVSVGGPTH